VVGYGNQETPAPAGIEGPAVKSILLTGAAGRIGTSLRNSLGQTYHFRCFDSDPVENEADTVVGNIMNPEELSAAIRGMDAVIHLAANPEAEQTWNEVYLSGIGGTYNVFEAARRAGIKKVIYASSTAVLGWRELQAGQWVSPNMSVHPAQLYGVGKATGELLARYFSETYEMSIVCLRIGFFYTELPYPQGPRDDTLRGWCSPEDLAQLVRQCLEADDLGFQVFYGVSNNRHRLWDIRNAQELVHYHPVDDAADWIRPPKQTHQRGLLKDHHRLLMRAALQEAPQAFESWRRWVDGMDIEKLDLDTLSYRLLPLVYLNLANQTGDDPGLGRLKGAYRRSWLENQLSLKQLIPFVAQLRRQGISVLLLDDMTSILRLYEGQGARRLYSFDLLVQPADVAKLLDFLVEQKIWPKVRYPSRFLSVETPLEIWSPFHVPFTAAWRVHPAIKTSGQAAAIWQHAYPTTLGDSDVFTLNLESHFLRSCLRSVGSRPEAAFFALMDAGWMLAKKSGEINWEGVVELARENRQVLPLVECLRELKGIIDLPLGNRLIAQLQHVPRHWTEPLEYRWLHQYQPYPGTLTRIGRRLLLYRRSPKIPGPLGFLRYLQFVWGGRKLSSLVRLVFPALLDRADG